MLEKWEVGTSSFLFTFCLPTRMQWLEIGPRALFIVCFVFCEFISPSLCFWYIKEFTMRPKDAFHFLSILLFDLWEFQTCIQCIWVVFTHHNSIANSSKNPFPGPCQVHILFFFNSLNLVSAVSMCPSIRKWAIYHSPCPEENSSSSPKCHQLRAAS